MKKVMLAMGMSILLGASLTACGAAGADAQETGTGMQAAGSTGPGSESTQEALQDVQTEELQEEYLENTAQGSADGSGKGLTDVQEEDGTRERPADGQIEDEGGKGPEGVQAEEGAGTDGRQDTQTEGPKRMFVWDGKLYEDTGETDSMLRCGMLDGVLTSSVDLGEIPAKDGQTNFGEGYGFQYGMRENRKEVCMDGVWHVFAYNENNFDGVSMDVKEHSATGAVVQFMNTTDLDVEYGEDYEIERKNKKTGEWEMVPYRIENAAFHDVAYEVPKNKPQTWEVDWKVFHGKLKPGTYRIVKTIMDFRGTGDFTEYTLMAGFQVD